MRAVTLADQIIRAGDQRVIVAGGMESMSQAPFLLPKARFGYRMGNGEVVDAMLHDGLVSTFDGRHMIEQASLVARELGIGREEQDAWALRSHERAVAAIDSGTLGDEIVTVEGVDHDEAPRRDTSLEKLSKLPPVLDPEGTTTVGNAPGLNDGAAALVVVSEEYARETRHRAAGHDRGNRLRSRRLRLPRPCTGARRGTRARRAGREHRGHGAGRDQRGVLLGRAALHPDARGRIPIESTSTGARSRLGIRSAPPAPGSSRRSPTSCAVAAAGSAWPRSARVAARGTRSSWRPRDVRARPGRRRRPDGWRDRPGRGRLGTSRSTLVDSAAGAVERGLERSSGRASTKLAAHGASTIRRRCSRASSLRRSLVEADLHDRGDRRGCSAKEELFRRADALLPRERDPRVEHLLDPDHRARRGDATTRPRRRHALLQPRAGDGARRGDPRCRDLRGDCRVDHRAGPRSGKTPAESNDFPGFVANRILMPLINEAAYAVDGGCRRARCRSTRSRGSVSIIRWARSRLPT